MKMKNNDPNYGKQQKRSQEGSLYLYSPTSGKKKVSNKHSNLIPKGS